MRCSLPILSAALLLASAFSFAPPAEAASRSAVLAACNRTAGCGYTKNKDNGDISGCSRQSGKCFYCPNDGKKQCFGVGRTLPAAGKLPKITNDAVLLTK
jgi:hypothetical protein